MKYIVALLIGLSGASSAWAYADCQCGDGVVVGVDCTLCFPDESDYEKECSNHGGVESRLRGCTTCMDWECGVEKNHCSHQTCESQSDCPLDQACIKGHCCERPGTEKNHTSHHHKETPVKH